MCAKREKGREREVKVNKRKKTERTKKDANLEAAVEKISRDFSRYKTL